MKLHLIMAAAAVSFAAFEAGGVSVVAGTTSGNWINPNPSAPPIVATGAGTPVFTWGDGTGFGTGPNSLSFAGEAFSGVTETAFKVGTITYFNGTTALGTTPDSVDLSLTLNFSTPALPSVTSSYAFTLNSTPNTGDVDASADFVNLPSSFGMTEFLLDGTTYRVRLTGFQNIVGDGFLGSNELQFRVREGLAASADLYGIVTTAQPVPEPETYALMLAGLAAMGSIARRRLQQPREP